MIPAIGRDHASPDGAIVSFCPVIASVDRELSFPGRESGIQSRERNSWEFRYKAGNGILGIPLQSRERNSWEFRYKPGNGILGNAATKPRAEFWGIPLQSRERNSWEFRYKAESGILGNSATKPGTEFLGIPLQSLDFVVETPTHFAISDDPPERPSSKSSRPPRNCWR